MWDWNEGASTTLSTFYQAAQLLDEYDFIFCHNEALLYEFVEEYEPALFEKIKELIKQGKWVVIGGWYLQPDCNLPSGESFVRQIKLGRKYFAEKFSQRPTVAINFDSFGHSVGLVQILKKTGFDGYMCCRPMSWNDYMVKLPDTEFLWYGKDGSVIKVARVDDLNLYSSGFGTAKTDIEQKAKIYKDKEVGVALWGVGNHGGNPSRKDLKDVNCMIANSEINGEKVEIKHSVPEEYFKQAKFDKTFDKSMQPCLIGCYAALSKIKQKNVELETALFDTEKICTLAYLNKYADYNQNAFFEAEKILAKLDFHDLLAGTVCPSAEKTSLEAADYALTVLRNEYDKAFFAYCARNERAKDGEFPIFIFNSQPYEREAVFETEFLLPTALVSDTEQYVLTVKQNGAKVKSQVIKEQININYDRRKRVAIQGTLPALSVARFDVSVEILPIPTEDKKQFTAEIVVPASYGNVVFDCASGALKSFYINGKEMLRGNAFMPVMYDDCPDPWGWNMFKIGKNPVDFNPSACDKGIFEGLKNINVVEDGEVFTEVESLYEKENSFVKVDYKVYKEMSYIDVSLEVLWNEKDKTLKLRIPAMLKGAFFGQIPYASDEFEKNGNEITAQRFVAIKDGENALYVANDCVYSYSMDGDELYITLLRGVAYCAHPINDRPLIKKDRFIDFAEDGKHVFNFRIGYCDCREIENAAQEFVSRREGLNYFPHGKNEISEKFELSNKQIALSACYVENGATVLRLFNNSEKVCETQIGYANITEKFSFGKYEVKTVLFDDKKFEELKIWL